MSLSNEEARVLYVDPSAGSMILQVAFAALLGAGLTVRRWWGNVSRIIKSGLGRFRAS
jgi:hypothetical protein